MREEGGQEEQEEEHEEVPLEQLGSAIGEGAEAAGAAYLDACGEVWDKCGQLWAWLALKMLQLGYECDHLGVPAWHRCEESSARPRGARNSFVEMLQVVADHPPPRAGAHRSGTMAGLAGVAALPGGVSGRGVHG
jgi:hypothetical protein